MNLLFLTLLDFKSLDEKNIYTDLLRKFVENHHSVFVISPTERKNDEATHLLTYENYKILKLKIGNMQKTNVIEKGITTITLEGMVLSAIKKYCADTKFDLVLYSTPPITFTKVVNYIKKRDGAKTYLLLKDIFPQNAVDLKMFSEKSLIHKYFRKKEENLYKESDYIGCMSQANVDYVIKHNSYINPDIVHVSPNSVEIVEENIDGKRRNELREKYNVPNDVTVFMYGGNLGKPQGIPFLIECLKANANRPDRFFVICGSGTEYGKLETYIEVDKPNNILLINGLPKAEYEEFVSACDVGLIFLDHRFTIPNFPSRILSYMQKKMPVLASTDSNTDMGKIITENGFGWWCESNDAEKFTETVEIALNADLKTMGVTGFEYLKENYTTERTYEIISDRLGTQ